MSIKDDVKEAAHTAIEDAKHTATRKVNEETAHLRDGAAAEGDHLADAAHAAADAYPRDSLVSQALGDLGSTVEGLTAQFRDKPAQEILDDVALFARRNPLLFLGGAALAGFAAARFLKAGPAEPRHVADTDPWTGHLDTRPGVSK